MAAQQSFTNDRNRFGYASIFQPCFVVVTHILGLAVVNESTTENEQGEPIKVLLPLSRRGAGCRAVNSHRLIASVALSCLWESVRVGDQPGRVQWRPSRYNTVLTCDFGGKWK